MTLGGGIHPGMLQPHMGERWKLEIAVGISPQTVGAFELGRSRGPVSLGRHAAWQLDAPGVEPFHAFLYFDGAELYVAGLHPERPIWINSTPSLVGWARVPPGSELRLGDAVLRYLRLGDGEGVLPAPSPSPGGPSPPPFSGMSREGHGLAPAAAERSVASRETLLLQGAQPGPGGRACASSGAVGSGAAHGARVRTLCAQRDDYPGSHGQPVTAALTSVETFGAVVLPLPDDTALPESTRRPAVPAPGSSGVNLRRDPLELAVTASLPISERVAPATAVDSSLQTRPDGDSLPFIAPPGPWASGEPTPLSGAAQLDSWWERTPLPLKVTAYLVPFGLTAWALWILFRPR